MMLLLLRIVDRELANRREKLVDEAEVRELIEVSGPMMSDMKKSLRKLDKFLIKDQVKQRLKLTAELGIVAVLLLTPALDGGGGCSDGLEAGTFLDLLTS